MIREGKQPVVLLWAELPRVDRTLLASLGASIAYGSLAATSFRGFADFAVIGAIVLLGIVNMFQRGRVR